MAGISTVYPPEVWVRESLMIFGNNNVMAPLVHRDFDDAVAEFGDVVNTRKPDKFSVASMSESHNAEFTVNAPTATNVAVTLNQHKVVGFGITSRQMAVSIKNLIEEFMAPAVVPIADEVDANLLNSTDGLGSATITTKQTTNSGVFDEVTGALVQKKLLDNQVPFAPISGVSRVSLVLCTAHNADLLQQDAIHSAEKQGLSPPPIRTGYVGMLYGMNSYVDQAVPYITTTTNIQSVAFHRNAITLVTRRLEDPPSDLGVRSSVMSMNGVGMRAMVSYQHTKLRYVVSIDILYGYKILDAVLACRIPETT